MLLHYTDQTVSPGGTVAAVDSTVSTALKCRLAVAAQLLELLIYDERLRAARSSSDRCCWWFCISRSVIADTSSPTPI